MSKTPFEAVIGLEVHAQLLTRTKLFCSCSTQFGAPPNSNTCPVCLALPGALPVLNREAVAMAIKAGLALSCRINQRSIFARKNYFYPDLPKGYQISQYELPLAEDGKAEVLTGRRLPTGKIDHYQLKSFGITRVHLEDDAGKSIHPPGQDTFVNLNRTGVPLIEIVSEPDFRTSQEAYDFLIHLRKILLYLGICDGNMEEGSLRCDANISVRPQGSCEFGTKTEIKNVNSFRFLQKALDYEIDRQIRVVSSGGSIHQETRLWDEQEQRTEVMRSKEYAHDYRYFPDPDLLPILISDEWLSRISRELPELPESRRQRLAAEHDLGDEESLLITQDRPFADFFEEATEISQLPRVVLNWMVGDLTRYLKRDNVTIQQCRVTPQALASLILSVEDGKISGKIAKDVFEKMIETGESPDEIIQRTGLQQISDEDTLVRVVEVVIGSNPEKVAAYRSGKTGLLGFFMGQVMRETGGKANPQVVSELLKSKLG